MGHTLSSKAFKDHMFGPFCGREPELEGDSVKAEGRVAKIGLLL